MRLVLVTRKGRSQGEASRRGFASRAERIISECDHLPLAGGSARNGHAGWAA